MRAPSAKFVAIIGPFVALGGQFDIMATTYRSNVRVDTLLMVPIDTYEKDNLNITSISEYSS